ncbi:RNA polymerase sigma factor [Echinimonas agarilytica]|uniref:RNA polymerase sigma factor n=1 Tax=Echinimonas agarilytica TaxID=1215918 RepID=A0AA42B7Y8_9GAMM|nr:sigma-70 family RNA polymerase sigma factor [Echinimonas agarilytica]MCM2679766.1 sigma-70 family RNA polymerase sigma factor [Echinimonas agarilytica]
MSQKAPIELTDIHIIEQVKRGDIHAYSILVRRYEPSVRACLRVRLETAHEAEDLAQEAFILAYKKLEDFQSDCSFGAWLRGIAINLLRNYRRKHKLIAVGGHAELETLVNEHIDERFNEDNESAHLSNLKSCFNRLDQKMRLLLNEHYNLGFSVTELCTKYDERHSTMTMRLYRLRQKLKSCIDSKMRDLTQ